MGTIDWMIFEGGAHIVPHNFAIRASMAARRTHVILNVAERSEGAASQPDHGAC